MTPRLTVLAAILCCCGAPSGAEAHDWYTGRTDPAYGNACCGGTDCAMMVVEPGMLTAEAGGYRIRMTLAETQKINPYSLAPIDALVPWGRVQPSEDGNFHICLMTFFRGPPRGGIYCFFAPPNS